MDYDEMVMDDYNSPLNNSVEDMVATLQMNTDEAITLEKDTTG